MNTIINKKGHVSETYIEMTDHVPVIKYKKLDIEGIRHGFSTRMGGVSTGAFTSMNLSFTRGDDPEKVMENFRRFGAAVGAAPEQMVFTDQTHTVNVKTVTDADCGRGILRDRDYHDIDGIVTDCPGVCLVTFFADCVPLFFVDPVKKVIGLSHSGWRGTVGKIGMETVTLMKKRFGCRPEDIIAAIGPSICRDCYEVGRDVADAFRASFTEAQYSRMITSKPDGRYLLDLWQANAFILEDSGILSGHIAMPDICTCCNSETMWSHRRTGALRGSLAAFLMIQERLME